MRISFTIEISRIFEEKRRYLLDGVSADQAVAGEVGRVSSAVASRAVDTDIIVVVDIVIRDRKVLQIVVQDDALASSRSEVIDLASADGDLGCLLALGTLNAYAVTVKMVAVVEISVVIFAAEIVDLAVKDIDVARTGIHPDAAGTFLGVRFTQIKSGELDVFDDDIRCLDGKKITVFHVFVTAYLYLAVALQSDAVLLDRKLFLIASRLLLDHDGGAFRCSIKR